MSFFMLTIATAQVVQENSKRKRQPIKTSNQLEITYGNPSWNIDSRKIDTATLVVKEKGTKRIVLINLQETAPDDNVFKGKFVLSWGELKKITPEIFIPNQNALKTRKGKQLVLKAIQEGKIKRKPFVLRKKSDGKQVIDVYDKKEQAKLALDNYRKQLRLRKNKKSIPSGVSTDTLGRKSKDLESVKKNLQSLESVQQQKEEQLAQEAALLAEQERIRLQQIEKKKAEERAKEQAKLRQAEILARKNKASKTAKQALKRFTEGDFEQAEKLFEKAVELDPTDKTYYYSYGVSSFRNSNFNKSIVILNLVDTKGTKVSPAERDYYLGLNHFKINDSKNAKVYFSKVVNSKVEPMASSASFYKGMIQFKEKKWDFAKADFQWVLDNSKDPKLDERAEQMIENISSQQRFEKNKAKQHLFGWATGQSYDSNILLLADGTDANAVGSSKGGFRLTHVGSYEWRPVFEKSKEWSLKTSITNTYSIDSSFKQADPTLFSLSSPFSIKFKKWKKSIKSTVLPKFEYLMMDADDDGTPEKLLNTFGFEWKSTVVNSGEWYSGYNLDYEVAESFASTSTGDDDASATTIGLNYQNTWIIDKKPTTLFINDINIFNNSANGKNNNYMKYQVSGTYLSPFKYWEGANQITTLSLFSQSYPDRDTPRTDTNIAISYNISKAITDAINFTGGLSYTNNNSDNSSSAYKKFELSSVFSGSFSL
ncbi:MAG: hypothetical protein AB8E15_06675 [Bdellovibrionales bacterium]